MDASDIRPIAVGLPTRGDEVLLSLLTDPDAGERFYRPVGGGLEFGEPSERAVVREFDEELDVTVTETEHVTTLERTFEFDGGRGHEIWFCYRVELAERWPYERDSFTGREPELDDDPNEEFEVRWVPVDDLDDVTVYPEHLARLLEE